MMRFIGFMLLRATLWFPKILNKREFMKSCFAVIVSKKFLYGKNMQAQLEFIRVFFLEMMKQKILITVFLWELII